MTKEVSIGAMVFLLSSVFGLAVEIGGTLGIGGRLFGTVERS